MYQSFGLPQEDHRMVVGETMDIRAVVEREGDYRARCLTCQDWMDGGASRVRQVWRIHGFDLSDIFGKL
jgi:hypothetical protein